MTVVAVGMDPAGTQPVLLLREVPEPRRQLPVLIGLPEAAAIELQRQGVDPPRPQTHDLIRNVVAAFGRSLQRVRITALRDGIYHAELQFDDDTRVSSRLTDAVALAVRDGIPIEAEEDVLEAGAAPVQLLDLTGSDDPGADAPEAEDPDAPPASAGGAIDEAAEVEELRRFLDTATPDDFGGDDPDPEKGKS
ncbi:MAG: bifunctional nuclease family protein [Pseudonocardia sp.]|uniref:bifunctional nuclease family protein n=1 Tax=unclassified Pseudonocardia TaxID=2619320 RepID=UPI001AC845AD|nr:MULTISPECIES: bifunctional nuclease family protein [unclassified Pseudonocardia]MBN9107659.1 bifunctional nuclease family protein [Pseudonocardia sp.]